MPAWIDTIVKSQITVSIKQAAKKYFTNLIQDPGRGKKLTIDGKNATKIDYDGGEWKMVPGGTCKEIGGTLKPFEGFNKTINSKKV